MRQWGCGRDGRLSRVRGLLRRTAARHLRARASPRVCAGSLVARQRSERAGRARTVGPPDRRSGSARHRSRLEHRRWRKRTQPSHRFSHLRPALSVRTWARSIGWCWPGGLSGRAQPWTWCVTPSSSTVGVPPPLSASRAASIDRRSLEETKWRLAMRRVDPSIPLLLVHGSSDEIVPPERSVVTLRTTSRRGMERHAPGGDDRSRRSDRNRVRPGSASVRPH